ncbi:uncharacterized protein [Notamacropus eugenii]|uniref:uncharacterized protein n=1 Tax=Notamacropus eugenii TaxID=9315 RepID=UPI003B6796A4
MNHQLDLIAVKRYANERQLLGSSKQAFPSFPCLLDAVSPNWTPIPRKVGQFPSEPELVVDRQPRPAAPTARPPGPGLTARQTPQHTCCLLRTTTPARLSPAPRCRAPVPAQSRPPGRGQGSPRLRRLAGGERRRRQGRRSGIPGVAQPSLRLQGLHRPPARPPARSFARSLPPGLGPGPGPGRRVAGRKAPGARGRDGAWASSRQPSARRSGKGSRAPARREGAAAAPRPEAWRRAAGGGAGRGRACSRPRTPRGGQPNHHHPSS